MKALVHCEGCSNQISKCLKGLAGVRHVQVDREHQRVTVKGEVVNDPAKVLERLRKKYSKNVELISPKPKPEKQKKAEEKKEQPKIKIVVLKMYMHCEGCVSDVKRKIEEMEGVHSVEVDKEKSRVMVRGTMDSTKLVEKVKKKLGKHVEIIKEDNKREPKREGSDNEKGNEDVNVIMYSYPPQYSTQYLYPNQSFSDENVFACSIM